jgi:hypothetical protein
MLIVLISPQATKLLWHKTAIAVARDRSFLGRASIGHQNGLALNQLTVPSPLGNVSSATAPPPRD